MNIIVADKRSEAAFYLQQLVTFLSCQLSVDESCASRNHFCTTDIIMYIVSLDVSNVDVYHTVSQIHKKPLQFRWCIHCQMMPIWYDKQKMVDISAIIWLIESDAGMDSLFPSDKEY